MSVIDTNKKEINFKIVYYGPARSGKTTSLEQLQGQVKSKKKSQLKKHPHTEQTIFFDFLALASESIGGFKTRFRVYTVPGQILYEDTRKILLKGVDAVIFVADSQLEKMQENIQSFEELKSNISQMGYAVDEVPIVIQYNKRDLPGIPSIEELRKVLNPVNYPDFETVATDGNGVSDAFKECLRQVLMSLSEM